MSESGFRKLLGAISAIFAGFVVAITLNVAAHASNFGGGGGGGSPSGVAGGGLSGTYPNPAIAQGGAAAGDIFQWSGSSWAKFTPLKASCSVSFTGAGPQVVAANSDTLLIWDTINYQRTSGANLFGAGNTSPLTAPFAGVYQIEGQVQCLGSGTGLAGLYIRRNGSEIGRQDFQSVTSATNPNGLSVRVSATIVLAASDTVQLSVFTPSTSNQNVSSTYGNTCTGFSITLLSNQ